MRPIVIFRGQQCPSRREQALHTRRVIVVWQEKAWFDRGVAKDYAWYWGRSQDKRKKVQNTMKGKPIACDVCACVCVCCVCDVGRIVELLPGRRPSKNAKKVTHAQKVQI